MIEVSLWHWYELVLSVKSVTQSHWCTMRHVTGYCVVVMMMMMMMMKLHHQTVLLLLLLMKHDLEKHHISNKTMNM